MNDPHVTKELSIPRCIMPNKLPMKTVQPHHLCDASEHGHGSVAHPWTVYETQQASANLPMAKSRLAPLKGSTTPRPEPAAALEAARPDTPLQKEPQMPPEKSVHWTDSTTVLWYRQTPEKRFQTHTANRAAKILEHATPDQWRHAPTMQNTGKLERGDPHRCRWRQVQHPADIPWHRWPLEHPPTPQKRQKWLTPKRNATKGDLVPTKQDHCTRNQRPPGPAMETHPSADGPVPSAAARTTKDTYERPTTKVCLLEGATSEPGETPRSGPAPSRTMMPPM
uniref:DUF5641 domain-containing protein n=1 Tax=Scylla olivacea TaxID=85551 RepID=A0A0P4VYM1_SCYOL